MEAIIGIVEQVRILTCMTSVAEENESKSKAYVKYSVCGFVGSK